MKTNIAIILDTSSLLRIEHEQLIELSSRGRIFIPSSVIAEMKFSSSAIKLNVFSDVISALKPSKKALNKVKKITNKFSKKLSNTDIEVLALALDLKEIGYDVTIYTEDFEIQNVSAKLGIKFSSVRRKSIRYISIYLKKCKVCGTEYEQSKSSCPNCGSEEFIIIKKVIKSVDKGLIYHHNGR